MDGRLMSTVILRDLFQKRISGIGTVQSLTVTGQRIKGVRKQKLVALVSGEEVTKTVAGSADLRAAVESMAAAYIRQQKDTSK